MSKKPLFILPAVILMTGNIVFAQPSTQINPWLGLSAGYGWYAMEDINDSYFDYESEEVKSGYNSGVEAGIELNKSVRLGACYRKFIAVAASSGDRIPDLTAQALYCSIDHIPDATSSVHPGFGIGFGRIWKSGEYKGNGPYIDFHISVDMPLGENGALVPQIGYRYASVSNHGYRDLNVDYTGLMLNISIRFFTSPIWN